jgi:SAM-dependent methyltransferase
VDKHVDVLLEADLDHGLPLDLDGGFDLIIATDILEHVRRPHLLLQQMGQRLAPGGRIVVSLPNFGHWYPRARTTLGVFDYDQRGILDQTHIRFYTRRSLLRLLQKNRLRVRRMEATGLPLEILLGRHSVARAVLARLDAALVRLRPTLFAYEFVIEVEPVPPPESIVWGRRRS